MGRRPKEGRCGPRDVRSVAVGGLVEGRLQAAELVVAVVEGELVDCVFGGSEVFGSEGEGAYARTLETEAGEELVGDGSKGRGVGGGLGQGAAAGGLGAVGVGDGERQCLGDLTGGA